MAYRRCISLRSALFARRSSPSFSYFSRENDLRKPEEFRSNIHEYLTTSLASNLKSGSWRYCMNRYMSTSMRDIATVLRDAPTETVASQVPAISEVAIAAADSAFPVAALQYLIDGVHTYTGLNWWASIALTAFLYRGATLPFLIYEHKATVKLALMQPPLMEQAETLQAMKTKTTDDEKVSKLEAYCTEFRKTLLITKPIQGFVFIDFYLAITNMAEQVPSFENGGAFWFTDLTTPDAMFILPILTTLTISARRHFAKLPSSSKQKLMVSDVIDVLFFGAVFSTMNFPQALYCHWIASNVFFCCYQYCTNLPGVKKALGFPEIPIPGQVRKP